MFACTTLKKAAIPFLRRSVASKVDPLKLGVIGVPFYRGQPNPGVDLGPKAIREEGKLISVLREQTGGWFLLLVFE